MAAELDGTARIVAGAFSSDPQRAREGAQHFGLPAERGYADWRAMIAAEAARTDGAEPPFATGAFDAMAQSIAYLRTMR
jgi:predicted dehydrogenase